MALDNVGVQISHEMMSGSEVVRIDQEGLILQPVKDGGRTVPNGEIGMRKVYRTSH